MVHVYLQILGSTVHVMDWPADKPMPQRPALKFMSSEWRDGQLCSVTYRFNWRSLRTYLGFAQTILGRIGIK